MLTTVAPCVPITSPTKEPEKLVAVPLNVAVMVPALKLPDESRVTIAFIVLLLVAVVAEFATLPAVAIVPNFVSVIAAADAISALTINELDRFPDASLCTTPAVVNASTDIAPADEIFKRSVPLVLSDKSPEFANNPDVVLPVNTNDGAAAVPAGSCNAPVIVSPAFSTLFDAEPVKLATIVPALKLPDASRLTIVLAVLALVAAFASTVAAATLLAV